MSNLAIHSKNPVVSNSSPVRTPVEKTTGKFVHGFGEAIKQLQEQATVYNPKNIQPNTSLRTDSIQVQGKVVFGFGDIETVTLDNPVITRTGGTTIPEPVPMTPEELAGWQKNMANEVKAQNEMPTFSGQIKMSDGSIADVKPVHIQVSTHEESVKLLQESGMTQAEAEEILKPKDVSQLSSKEQTPEEYKAYLMSKQVDAVARDTEGNIVAKIYKDGSLMCSNELADSLAKCSSNAERIRILQKNSNVTISDHTKTKMTDFDLLKEEFAQIGKRLSIHPELRALYDPDIVELQRRTLAA